MRVLTLCLAAAYLMLLATPAPAQRKPLTDDEQRIIKQAIDSGISWLKRAQAVSGDWPRRDANYTVGFTALPALTLLECGTPANDPQILKSARLVRHLAPKLEGTYEVALAILFLDRLNHASDRVLIQTLATRLLGGQTHTGGWGYKVPLVSPADQKTILTALRKLDPPSATRVLKADDSIKVGDKPGEKKQGDEKGERPKTPDVKPSDRPAEDRDRMPVRIAERRWLGCIREVDWVPDQAAAPTTPREKPAKLAEVVPARLRTLPIFTEANVQLVDPENRAGEAQMATTDNSNTHFALLALLAASRHDVVINRSMKLLVRRFQTSQNEDGTWAYAYRKGGGGGGVPAMTCVGLSGLAVGHGVAEKPMARDKIDPVVLRGFKAAAGFVGEAVPTGEPVGAMPNLYTLWSLERVAVLYDLDMIANKDWYRWASQLLVAHQKEAGNWEEGGYHGAHPVLDTCFALLVLQRVNLLRTLSGRSAFDSRALEKAVNETPAPKKTESPPAPPPVEEKVVPPTPTPAPAPPVVVPAVTPVITPAPPPTPTPEPANPGAGWLLWVALGVVMLLVLLALIAVLISLSGGKKDEDEDDYDDDEDDDDEPDERPRRRSRPPSRRR